MVSNRSPKQCLPAGCQLSSDTPRARLGTGDGHGDPPAHPLQVPHCGSHAGLCRAWIGAGGWSGSCTLLCPLSCCSSGAALRHSSGCGTPTPRGELRVGACRAGLGGAELWGSSGRAELRGSLPQQCAGSWKLPVFLSSGCGGGKEGRMRPPPCSEQGVLQLAPSEQGGGVEKGCVSMHPSHQPCSSPSWQPVLLAPPSTELRSVGKGGQSRRFLPTSVGLSFAFPIPRRGGCKGSTSGCSGPAGCSGLGSRGPTPKRCSVLSTGGCGRVGWMWGHVGVLPKDGLRSPTALRSCSGGDERQEIPLTPQTGMGFSLGRKKEGGKQRNRSPGSGGALQPPLLHRRCSERDFTNLLPREAWVPRPWRCPLPWGADGGGAGGALGVPSHSTVLRFDDL